MDQHAVALHDFIERCGGREIAAKRLKISYTTLSNYVNHPDLMSKALAARLGFRKMKKTVFEPVGRK